MDTLKLTIATKFSRFKLLDIQKKIPLVIEMFRLCLIHAQSNHLAPRKFSTEISYQTKEAENSFGTKLNIKLFDDKKTRRSPTTGKFTNPTSLKISLRRM